LAETGFKIRKEGLTMTRMIDVLAGIFGFGGLSAQIGKEVAA